MSIDELIRSAVTPIIPLCYPNYYTGDETEYCVFNYYERGMAFADDEATATVFSVQLHWYLPHGINPNAKKRQVIAALLAAGFTRPEITNASDSEGQHYVFECELGADANGNV